MDPYVKYALLVDREGYCCWTEGHVVDEASKRNTDGQGGVYWRIEKCFSKDQVPVSIFVFATP